MLLHQGGKIPNARTYIFDVSRCGGNRLDAYRTHSKGSGRGPEVGVAPECPYGYYDTAPYACAPYGYYGPEWFTGGVFIGAGPWFHGAANFHGHVEQSIPSRTRL